MRMQASAPSRPRHREHRSMENPASCVQARQSRERFVESTLQNQVIPARPQPATHPQHWRPRLDPSSPRADRRPPVPRRRRARFRKTTLAMQFLLEAAPWREGAVLTLSRRWRSCRRSPLAWLVADGVEVFELLAHSHSRRGRALHEFHPSEIELAETRKHPQAGGGNQAPALVFDSLAELRLMSGSACATAGMCSRQAVPGRPALHHAAARPCRRRGLRPHRPHHRHGVITYRQSQRISAATATACAWPSIAGAASRGLSRIRIETGGLQCPAPDRVGLPRESNLETVHSLRRVRFAAGLRNRTGHQPLLVGAAGTGNRRWRPDGSRGSQARRRAVMFAFDEACVAAGALRRNRRASCPHIESGLVQVQALIPRSSRPGN